MVLQLPGRICIVDGAGFNPGVCQQQKGSGKVYGRGKTYTLLASKIPDDLVLCIVFEINEKMNGSYQYRAVSRSGDILQQDKRCH